MSKALYYKMWSADWWYIKIGENTICLYIKPDVSREIVENMVYKLYDMFNWFDEQIK